MKTLRLVLVSIALLFAPLGANATAFSTDYTDLWFDPAEPGWGVTIFQQDNTIFAAFFVYEGNSTSAWFFASSAPYVSSTSSGLTFAGPLYQALGTGFGSAWNPNALNIRQVGTVTFLFTTINQATVSYSVDGVQVTKPLLRNAFKNNSVAGDYIGALIGTYSGCGAGVNGYAEELGVISITQSGSTASVRAIFTGYTCTFSGTLQQAGRLSYMNGNVTCTNGTAGTFSAYELSANISGLTGRATANYGGSCRWSGRLGGLRRGQ